MLSLGPEVKGITVGKSGSCYYQLLDGRVIYDVIGVKYYLFQNLIDFESFIALSQSEKTYVTTAIYPIDDENFIEHKDEYINTFIKRFTSKIAFERMDELKRIDEFLSTLDKAQLWELRIPIIATCGEFLINKSNTGTWKYLNTSIKGVKQRQPIFIVEGKLISPSLIFDLEYDKKLKNKNYQVNFFDGISSRL